MSAKRKDHRQERRSLQILESAGYGVSRLAGSTLGIFTAIGISDTDSVLLLVKCSEPSAEEIAALQKIRTPVNYRRMVHLWHRFQRHPTVIVVP